MEDLQYHSALQDFRRARHRVDLGRIIAFLKERSALLLPSDDLDKTLQARHTAERELEEIPLDAIVGSLSHYYDFTRSFFPKNEENQVRWAIVEILMNDIKGGLPPIDVYQIEGVYFVCNGSPQVSVAQQMGATVIEAYVTTVNPSIHFLPELPPDEQILNIESTEFLRCTCLDTLCSLKDIGVTIPGKYQILEEQIEVCQYYMNEEQHRKVPYEEVVIHWYDNIFLPAIKMIEGLEILRDFPERTATDLFIWIFEHRSLTWQLKTLYEPVYVAEIWDTISDTSEEYADEQIVQAEYQKFLEHTHLHKLRPAADLYVTISGKYGLLEEHIHVHRYFMGLEQKRKIPYHEAVVHWYDSVYLPIVQVIQAKNILENFPSHTITDLYVWISEYQIISRQNDTSRAEAFLTEIWTKNHAVLFAHLDEFIIIIEYIDFLIHTHLHKLRVKADLTVSTPGKYRVLEKHIEIHRYFMGIEQQREILYAEAVERWYDDIYLPTLQVIAEHRILREFLDLTATDLYLWLSEHRSTVEKQLGYSIDINTAAIDLINRFGSHKSSPLSRRSKKVLDVAVPQKSTMESSPDRQQRAKIAVQRKDHLCAEMLVPINGRKDGWYVLEQALEIAQYEDAHVSGLHIVSSKHQLDSDAIFRLKNQFEQRCKAVHVEGELLVEVGNIAGKICEHVCQTDLVILHLIHPPDSQTSLRLQSELPAIQRRCTSPLLALPKGNSPMNKALLIYDGSPKANEALFVSAYLAEQWGVSLVVMTANTEASIRSFVKNYLLRFEIEATFVQQRGKLCEWIRKVVREYSCDFIILGGSDKHSILDFVFGRTAEPGLNTIQCPLLIC